MFSLSEPHKAVSLTLPIDTVVMLDASLPVTDVGELLCQSITEQLVAMETCLCQFAKVGIQGWFSSSTYNIANKYL